MLKFIFIDIDDTLLDFDACCKETIAKGFNDFNLGEFKDDTLKMFHEVNDVLWHQIETKELTFEELKKIRFNKFFSKIGISFDGVKFESYFRDNLYDSCILEDGVVEVLSYLKNKNYILATASNGPYNQQIHRLKKADIYSYFDFNFISEKIGYSKPSKEFFDEAIFKINQKYYIRRDECIMIGDSLTSDIQGGLNACMKTCFYNKKNKELKNFKGDFVIYKLKDLEKIL